VATDLTPTRSSTRRATATLVALAVLAGTLLAGAVSAAPAQAASARLTGNDISWPQCPKGMGIPSRRSEGQPMPPSASRFVVIGLTNGPAFYPNPCLADQVAFAKKRHLWTAAYAMTTYPTEAQLSEFGKTGPYKGTSRIARLRNAGFAQAQFNVRNMRKAGLNPPMVWIDVEPYRVAPWSENIEGNRAVVRGAIWGYAKEGLKVGFYSTPYLWRSIVGPLEYGKPEWRATGHSNRATAQRSCTAESIQGGRAVLGQWVYQNRDWNVTCSGVAGAMRTYFRKY
jgi:hypothetical protein